MVTANQSEDTADVEASASGPSSLTDPFQIRDGIVPEDELAGLRQRKKGKSIAHYQIQQNSVRPAGFSVGDSLYDSTFSLQLILDLLKPMEEHTEDAKMDEAAVRLPVSADPLSTNAH